MCGILEMASVCRVGLGVFFFRFYIRNRWVPLVWVLFCFFFFGFLIRNRWVPLVWVLF